MEEEKKVITFGKLGLGMKFTLLPTGGTVLIKALLPSRSSKIGVFLNGSLVGMSMTFPDDEEVYLYEEE